MESWIEKQTLEVIKSWESSIDSFYPANSKDWSDCDQHVYNLQNNWNTLDAVKSFPWEKYLVKNELFILDLGCGTGWLSAYLSNFPQVKKIIALDSSERNLKSMLPGVVKALGGLDEKIIPLRALFSPLLVGNETYDLVVSSSSFHHADSLISLTEESLRVLKPGGHLIVLNETPYSKWEFRYIVIRKLVKHFLSLWSEKIQKNSETISESGIVYDPFLGDKLYSVKQWEKALGTSGDGVEIVYSGLPSYKKEKSRELVHFVVKKLK